MLLMLLSVIHIIICIFLILVVLLQQGKGADLSVFGGGGTQAAFGARGATTLLHKLTVASFVAFIVTTMSIGFIRTGGRDPVLHGLPGAPTPVQQPAADEQEVPTTGESEADTPPPVEAAPSAEEGALPAGTTGEAAPESAAEPAADERDG